MAVPFTLAHLSDIHLGPMPDGALWKEFALKRAIGWLSWRFNRKKLHDPAVADMIAADIAAAAPDHVALTGDLVNIASPAEFPHGARWMDSLAGPQEMSFVPGNHDAYVAFPWNRGLGHFAPWMEGEMRLKMAAPFPFVRLRKNVALIGLNSGVPQPLRRAGGVLGQKQLESLALTLRDLRERGYARVVLIHHPPLPGLSAPHKALSDAGELRDVLAAEGAELVLHGHNHEHMLNTLNSRFGTVHVLGVPSASLVDNEHHPFAAWNLYQIQRQAGKWQIDVSIRSYDPASRQISRLTEFVLSS